MIFRLLSSFIIANFVGTLMFLGAALAQVSQDAPVPPQGDVFDVRPSFLAPDHIVLPTEEYAPTSFGNLALMLVKYETLDLSNPRILDDVGMIAYCDVYQNVYDNEFEWDKFRQVMRQTFAEKRASLPSKFSYVVKVKLDRYNPQKKAFEFPDRAILSLSEIDLVRAQEQTCGQSRSRFLPIRYLASLRPLLKMENLPVSEEKAKQVVERMLQNNNTDRVVFLRFKIQIKDVLAFNVDKQRNETVARLDARVESVDAFEDAQGAYLIGTYTFDASQTVDDQLKIPSPNAPNSPSSAPALPPR